MRPIDLVSFTDRLAGWARFQMDAAGSPQRSCEVHAFSGPDRVGLLVEVLPDARRVLVTDDGSFVRWTYDARLVVRGMGGLTEPGRLERDLVQVGGYLQERVLDEANSPTGFPAGWHVEADSIELAVSELWPAHDKWLAQEVTVMLSMVEGVGG